jgi:hypothetical protein
VIRCGLTIVVLLLGKLGCNLGDVAALVVGGFQILL